MAEIKVFVGNVLYPCELNQGQHVRFVYLPYGNQTPVDQRRTVFEGTVENESGRTIGIVWNDNGRTRRTVLLHRTGQPDIYRFGRHIGHPQF